MPSIDGGKLRFVIGISSVVAVAALGSAGLARAQGDVMVVPGPPVNVRPGPDALYLQATSPLLENTGIWQAQPILVSGASAYRAGEFLYQDYLFDESGTYPNDPAYSAKNNADLVELRLRPTDSATAVRLTLDSMQDFEDIGATIALGGEATDVASVPHGANARMPAEVFVTVHGASGDIIDAASGAVLPQTPAVSVDTERRQVDLRIPHSAFDPTGRTVRVGAAVGLWDPVAGAYRPNPPGAAFFNVAFRYLEPPGPPFPPDWAATTQTAALQAGDLSAFSASVDFTKLAAKVEDDMPGTIGGVPQTGLIPRIYASSFEQQQGRGPAPTVCKQPCGEVVGFPGQLQPYMLDVPTTPPPDGGYGLSYSLHGSGANYRPNPAVLQVHADVLQSLVVYPEGRGASHWYWSLSATDVFEAGGDAMRNYPINPDIGYLMGGSMGGYGTYRLSAGWPDLFAAIAPTIACTAAETGWTGPPATPRSGAAAVIHRLAPSWRNVQMLSDFGASDTTCSNVAHKAMFAGVDQLGYRYEWREYPGDHLSSAFAALATDMTQWDNFLKGKRVVRDPAHVTYVYNVLADQPEFGLNADHAYWVSGLRARDTSGDAPMGTIDVFSHGFGVGDSLAYPTDDTVGPGYTGKRKTWGDQPSAPVQDVLDIVATNIAAVTIDVARAHLSCNPTLNVTSDGAITITLAGCPAT